ncbi:DUF21 domain-containing protein [Hibiscus syriacus]|uniref:DUF21 domain-containing protein n=1 Tax=Hibiscus syriacus TaxID=106335 RepID=A0A6A3BP97_HIBSY|nr:arginine/serine-rich coiled-coil protein 2-like isoform X2 [Hibiscus syriacus]KAE8716912.1 DUF21 domain-containing protein [Hibiscus syriacus]
MDLETENRIAAILLKEAAELRRQADREGVHIYCQQPKARGRSNSRFLTATVLGVQQANRAVEVNEMWRVRQKELELNDRLKGRSKNGTKLSRSYGDSSNSSRRTSEKHETDLSSSSSSSKIIAESSYLGEDEGLRDEEIEKFLQSRVKRGRGSVGSRMDETGPYLPTNSHSPEMLSTYPIAREHRVTLGPEKPSSLTSDESFSDEELREHRRKKEKDLSKSSENKHRRKHKSKEKSIDKKRKREEKRRKYR